MRGGDVRGLPAHLKRDYGPHLRIPEEVRKEHEGMLTISRMAAAQTTLRRSRR